MECEHFNTVEKQNGPHLELRCVDCDKHLKFLKQSNKKTREANHSALVSKYSKGYCECCLRTKSALPPPQTLEAHHIVPYQFEGDSSKDNIWIVCTQCHKLIEHLRHYLGHYGGQHNFVVL